MRAVVFIVSIMMLALLPTSFDPIKRAEAATDCAGEIPSVRWNETISRVALTPSTSDYWYYDDYGDRDGRDRGVKPTQEIEESATISEGPEESWMSNNDYWTLDSLNENVRATMIVGNNSIGAYMVNLSHEYRTTFCVTLQGLSDGNFTDTKADVYLMTQNDFQRYSEEYNMQQYFGEQVKNGFGASKLSPKVSHDLQ